MRTALSTLPLLAILAGTSGALAQHTETEANNTKATANVIAGLASGGTITGTSTGSSTTSTGSATADNFLISTASAGAAIYRHRLVIESSPAGHTATIRGLSRSGGAPNAGTDATVQTSSTTTSPPRYVQWYGFGRQEQVYARVTGTTSTTSQYTATLTTETVTPIDAGTFYQGAITVGRPSGVSTDYDMWVYDASFNAIPDFGIDDPESFTRTYGPGTYYIACSPSNLANNQNAGSGDTALTTPAMDFPDAVAASLSTVVASMPIRITDDFGPVDIAAGRGAFEVIWVKFVVSATPPATGSCCLQDGSCVMTTAASCATQQGAYGGPGSDCTTASCPQPGACCFTSDYSCQVLSSSQCAAAGGSYSGNGTACASCAPAPAGSVLILAADGATTLAHTEALLEATGLFPAVVSKVVQSTGTANPAPTLPYISQFDAVLVWSNNDFAGGVDATTMGNMLADYVDAGKGVVTTLFVSTSATVARQLGGRWDSSYQIIVPGGGFTTGGGDQVGIGTRDVPDHPILENVNTFRGTPAGGNGNYRPTSTALTSHGQRVAAWTDGKTLVAVSTTRPNRVDLGMRPINSTFNTTGWDPTTDGARLMANALLYTMPPSCPGNLCGPSDYNADGDVGTDQDIEAFFACLGGNCCTTCFCQGGDFNGDGDVGTDQDIEAFFRVLGGGNC